MSEDHSARISRLEAWEREGREVAVKVRATAGLLRQFEEQLRDLASQRRHDKGDIEALRAAGENLEGRVTTLESRLQSVDQHVHDLAGNALEVIHERLAQLEGVHCEEAHREADAARKRIRERLKQMEESIHDGVPVELAKVCATVEAVEERLEELEAAIAGGKGVSDESDEDRPPPKDGLANSTTGGDPPEASKECTWKHVPVEDFPGPWPVEKGEPPPSVERIAFPEHLMVGPDSLKPSWYDPADWVRLGFEREIACYILGRRSALEGSPQSDRLASVKPIDRCMYAIELALRAFADELREWEGR